MHNCRRSSRVPRWPLPLLLLLFAVAGNARAQSASGPALVLKGIAQYEDSALFESAIASLEGAMKLDLDSRDSTRAYFYLGFCYYKLGQPRRGDLFLRNVVRLNPDARLPAGADEFADNLARIKQQMKEQPDIPIEELPPPVDTAPSRPPGPATESVFVTSPVPAGPRIGNYVVGASAGAALGLASYFTSVLFDNLAVDRLKAYSMSGDSATAAGLKGEAVQYHTLGSAFYYSSYPLIALGFYLGLKVSEKMIPAKVSFLRDDGPTRLYCSLSKDLGITLGVRRNLW